VPLRCSAGICTASSRYHPAPPARAFVWPADTDTEGCRLCLPSFRGDQHLAAAISLKRQARLTARPLPPAPEAGAGRCTGARLALGGPTLTRRPAGRPAGRPASSASSAAFLVFVIPRPPRTAFLSRAASPAAQLPAHTPEIPLPPTLPHPLLLARCAARGTRAPASSVCACRSARGPVSGLRQLFPLPNPFMPALPSSQAVSRALPSSQALSRASSSLFPGGVPGPGSPPSTPGPPPLPARCASAVTRTPNPGLPAGSGGPGSSPPPAPPPRPPTRVKHARGHASSAPQPPWPRARRAPPRPTPPARPSSSQSSSGPVSAAISAPSAARPRTAGRPHRPQHPQAEPASRGAVP
jgi:hypothetical protein